MVILKVAEWDWDFDEVPNTCPLCHHAIHPRHIGGVVRHREGMGGAKLELVFQCPRKECLRVFIGRYDGRYSRSINRHVLRLQSTAPFSPEPPHHSDEVARVSEQFVAIFAEAAAAEKWRLLEIAGCGYRKALEFLVKDYCILIAPADESAIKAKFLGKVIDEYLTDTNIKQCAKRATWLGNDETHYVRRWTGKDLTDLKNLISLTESWITTAERTKSYLASMPDGNRSR